VVIRPRPSVLC